MDLAKADFSSCLSVSLVIFEGRERKKLYGSMAGSRMSLGDSIFLRFGNSGPKFPPNYGKFQNLLDFGKNSFIAFFELERI